MRATFSEFVLDLDKRELSRAGHEIHIPPKTFRLLEILLRSAPKAVSKEDLYSALWGETFVDEANISNLVFEVRSLLGDDKKRPRFIRTVHRFGYRFAGDVKWRSDAVIKNARRCSIFWGSREFPLAEGENVIGRDPDVAVSVESPGVSRRHAKVTVDSGEASIQDLGSKNGTLIDGKKINTAMPLSNGETIRLGSVSLIFRRFDVRDSTLTESVL